MKDNAISSQSTSHRLPFCEIDSVQVGFMLIDDEAQPM